jgi:hypothetical protein
MNIKPGELFSFPYINSSCSSINQRNGLYIGPDFFYRSDGIIVENHGVLLFGDSHYRIIDNGLLRFMKKIKRK